MNYVSIIQRQIKNMQKVFFGGCRSFLGPGSEKKWYGTYDRKPDGSWNRTAEKMLQNFRDSGHPVFRCTSPLERGQLRSKGGGKTTIYFTEERKILSCASRMVISVNQLSLYGAVADMIERVGVLVIGSSISGCYLWSHLAWTWNTTAGTRFAT